MAALGRQTVGLLSKHQRGQTIVSGSGQSTPPDSGTAFAGFLMPPRVVTAAELFDG
nr:hypothetical protein [Euryarchaeota archaeon]